MNYLGCLHNAKTFENGFLFCGATYYFIFVGSVAILVLSRTCGLVKYAQSLEKKPKATVELTATSDANKESKKTQ